MSEQDDEAAAGAGPLSTGPLSTGPLGGGLGEVGERLRAARALLDRPLTSYYLIAGITTLLLCLGLVMVLSTGSVADLQQGESPYHDFELQLAGIVAGVPVMWLLARAQPRLFRAMAYPLLAV
ncbi:MAG TPA: putative lipid II flippase FtsW, partial [Trebonia sp.]|nr:putative lipid II flippase FtsW [Trebonia sp.]